MTRIRTIKPEFWCDEKLAQMSTIDRLVFLGLMSMADDYGRVHDNIKVIDAFMFPYSEESSRESVANLSRTGRIVRGISSSGMKILEIVNWSKHQRVDKPQPLKALPPIYKKNAENSNENSIPEPFANDSGMVPELVAPLTSYHRPPTTDQGSPINMSADRGRSFSEYSDEFENFWKAYPKQRRTKKQEAYRKWKLALKRVDAETLTKKAAEYASSDVGKSEFAVMPTVWLNGACWEDDPAAWEKREPIGGSGSKRKLVDFENYKHS